MPEPRPGSGRGVPTRRPRAVLAALVCCGIAAAPTGAGGGKLTPELRAHLDLLADREPAAVIVRLPDRVDRTRAVAESGVGGMLRALRRQAERSQAPLRRFLRARGVGEVTSLLLINGLAFRAGEATIRELAALPGIERVGLDRQWVLAPHLTGPGSGGGETGSGRYRSRSPVAPAAPRYATPEWNIARINAPALWDLGITGTGIVVATMDSGADPDHADLGGRWRGGTNSWYDPHGEHPGVPFDKTGHGTAVLGVLVGGDAGGTSIGVAPGASWIASRIWNDAGQTSYSVIHLGYDWIADPDGDPGTDDYPHVLNNSWGLDAVGQCVLEFQTDLQTLRAAGIAVVFSGGNSGPTASTSVSPANNPEGFAVGAIDDFDAVDFRSSRGPSACGGTVYPEVAAPGVEIWTADLTSGGFDPFAYNWTDGTSVAAPHVAGAMALLLQAYPGTSPAQLQQAILNTALDLGPAGPDHDTGHGRVDALAAHGWLATQPPCTDGDGDGVNLDGGGCGAADCDDTDARVWSAPGEVTGLTFAADGVTLSWSAPPSGGGTAGTLVFDTLRAGTPTGFGSPTCIESDDGSDTSAVDTEAPPPGSPYHYLVRADNACPGPGGTLGADSSGTPRAGAGCP